MYGELLGMLFRREIYSTVFPLAYKFFWACWLLHFMVSSKVRLPSPAIQRFFDWLPLKHP